MWHYVQNGQAVGPVADAALREQLNSGQLPGSTLIWREGMAQWLPASQCGLAAPIADPSSSQSAPFPGSSALLQGDTTGGLIPYKNPTALTSYYLAVGSLIPCLGLFLGPVAFFLGWRGLAYGKANPIVKGVAHAWVGILLGGFCSLVNIGLILFALFSVTTSR